MSQNCEQPDEVDPLEDPEEGRAGAQRDASAFDDAGLRKVALAYVARYATTAARLRAYLERRVVRRGWRASSGVVDGGEGTSSHAVTHLVEWCVERGYIDDRAFAEARGGGLLRRGLGRQRIDQDLIRLGVGHEDREATLERLFSAPAAGDPAIRPDDDSNREGADPQEAAALAYARRRRFGPFARSAPDAAANRRAFAAMIRAGHPASIVTRILTQAPARVSTGNRPQVEGQEYDADKIFAPIGEDGI